MLINKLEVICFCCVLVISLAFYIVRKRMYLFHLISATTLASFIYVELLHIGSTSLAQILLLTVGLGLYWFGLTSIRVMLTRSVSLNLLACYESGLDSNTLEKDIVG